MNMLDERAKKVLCAVVESYINFPEPVGSRAVTKKYSFGVSPATIRNIMADLVEMGYLMQPHTSAGRVPTDKGYRFYVDLLISETEYQDDINILQEMHERLNALRNNIDVLFSETTKTLSVLSHYLGIAMSPRLNTTILEKIELIKIDKNRLVAIISTDEGMKTNVVSIDSDITQRDLSRITDYINTKFSGNTFHEIRTKVLNELVKEKTKCDRLILKAMRICREAISFIHSDLYFSGLSEVLDLPDFADLEKIRELSRAIEDKHTIIQLLDIVSESDGVQILIGSENTMKEMKKLSMVISPCKVDDQPVGVVGIIGPTRMDYEKVIYIVDNTAKLITQILMED